MSGVNGRANEVRLGPERSLPTAVRAVENMNGKMKDQSAVGVRGVRGGRKDGEEASLNTKVKGL